MSIENTLLTCNRTPLLAIQNDCKFITTSISLGIKSNWSFLYPQYQPAKFNATFTRTLIIGAKVTNENTDRAVQLDQQWEQKGLIKS